MQCAAAGGLVLPEKACGTCYYCNGRKRKQRQRDRARELRHSGREPAPNEGRADDGADVTADPAARPSPPSRDATDHEAPTWELVTTAPKVEARHAAWSEVITDDTFTEPEPTEEEEAAELGADIDAIRERAENLGAIESMLVEFFVAKFAANMRTTVVAAGQTGYASTVAPLLALYVQHEEKALDVMRKSWAYTIALVMPEDLAAKAGGRFAKYAPCVTAIGGTGASEALAHQARKRLPNAQTIGASAGARASGDEEGGAGTPAADEAPPSDSERAAPVGARGGPAGEAGRPW